MDYYDVMLCDVHGHTKVGPCPYCTIRERDAEIARLREQYRTVAGVNHNATLRAEIARLREELNAARVVIGASACEGCSCPLCEWWAKNALRGEEG